ncbi:MAG: hypothetical protein WBF68_02930 [Atribacterota bacterium]
MGNKRSLCQKRMQKRIRSLLKEGLTHYGFIMATMNNNKYKSKKLGG